MSIVSRMFGLSGRRRLRVITTRAILTDQKREDAIAAFMKLPPEEQIARHKELAALFNGWRMPE
jgi:hypothetical protein